jgi:hypothetical protein
MNKPDSMKLADETDIFRQLRAFSLVNQVQPEEEPCATEAYFKAHKDSPFGGATAVWLVCTCPRCRSRVTL